MLICIVCGKVIANTNPEIHYGGCSECDLKLVEKGMEELKKEGEQK